MVRRCPACGFESPDDARWCDFCKEPFRKIAEPKTPTPQEPLAFDELPPEVRARLKGLKPGDAGDAVPKAPTWARTFAWAFLAGWIVVGMLLAGMLMAKRAAWQDQQAPAKAPSRR